MRVVDFIVCDDVRTEINGKFSIVGLYADQLVVEQGAAEPFNFLLAVFVRLEILPDDPVIESFAMTITLNGEPLGEAVAPVTAVTDKRLAQVIVQLKPLPVPTLGELRFKVEFFREGQRIFDPYEYRLLVKRRDA